MGFAKLRFAKKARRPSLPSNYGSDLLVHYALMLCSIRTFEPPCAVCIKAFKGPRLSRLVIPFTLHKPHSVFCREKARGAFLKLYRELRIYGYMYECMCETSTSAFRWIPSPFLCQVVSWSVFAADLLNVLMLARSAGRSLLGRFEKDP